MRIKIYILYLFYIIIFIDLHHFRKVYKYPRIVNFMHFVNTMIEWKRSVFLGRVAERRDNKFYKFTTVIHPLNKIPIESIEHRTISKRKKKIHHRHHPMPDPIPVLSGSTGNPISKIDPLYCKPIAQLTNVRGSTAPFENNARYNWTIQLASQHPTPMSVAYENQSSNLIVEQALLLRKIVANETNSLLPSPLLLLPQLVVTSNGRCRSGNRGEGRGETSMRIIGLGAEIVRDYRRSGLDSRN